jgi:hypothetical protein
MDKDVEINNCAVGLDITQGGDNPATGSVILPDATIRDTTVGVLVSFSEKSTSAGAGTLVLDKVDFVNTDPVISFPNSTVIAKGNRKLNLFLDVRVHSTYERSYERTTSPATDPPHEPPESNRKSAASSSLQVSSTLTTGTSCVANRSTKAC